MGTSDRLTPAIAEIDIASTNAMRNRAASLCPTATRSARFHGRSGPNGRTSNKGAISDPKVRSKNGAPTEIEVPAIASRSSG